MQALNRLEQPPAGPPRHVPAARGGRCPPAARNTGGSTGWVLPWWQRLGARRKTLQTAGGSQEMPGASRKVL
eukprot:6220621-Alexandrium_andersonii.AAC.1